MGRKPKPNDLISIAEACYEETGADRDWLRHLLERAQPVLDQGGGLGLSLVKENGAGRGIALSEGLGALEDMLRLSWPVIEQLDEATYREFFYPGKPVVLASSLVAGFALPARRAFSSLLEYADASDLLGLLGYPIDGWAFSLFMALGRRRLSPQVKASLLRLRIHVEAGIRLRVIPRSAAVAVIHPDGRLVHAEGDALAHIARTELRTQATTIERVRGGKQRVDAHRALAVWRALVQGRWSVVERVEHDGKRLYYAFENAPQTRERHGLGPGNSRILTAALRGLSNKEIAYEIGCSNSSVSNVLAACARRLGFTGREQLLRVAAGLRGQLDGRTAVQLTTAEREVLTLVRRGLSNAAIAKARRVSPHTVAAQLRSIRRRVGGVSRRALLLLDV